MHVSPCVMRTGPAVEKKCPGLMNHVFFNITRMVGEVCVCASLVYLGVDMAPGCTMASWQRRCDALGDLFFLLENLGFMCTLL